ncbi:protein NYNRIN-like [Drosophila gunungcola]|uniref:protein NYNRIN-like n=1 Tax=Drosophila gunungcola TaxID=103775 RepID=UPI0022E1D5BA|nr:protein NYNRIN-like [Drosophila gunungcola]
MSSEENATTIPPPGTWASGRHSGGSPNITSGLDFIGTWYGNTMLLVFIDIFSKWVELIPLKKATAAQLKFGFRERILARFGAPRRLTTARNSPAGFRAFCRNNGIQLEYTAPYSPQQNPTERANRTIKTMISQYVNQDHRTWDQLLPEIFLAINTSISDSTGFSPACLVQGREPRLQGALFNAVASDLHASPLDPTERAKRLQEAFRTALETNQIASQEQSRQYNLRRREWRSQIGSQVLVRLHHLSKAREGFNAKLAPKYAGPFKVVKFLQQVDGRKRRTAGIGDLKEYHPREKQHDDSTEDPRRSDSQPTLDDVPDTTLPE